MAETREVIGGGEPARPGADDEDALAARRRIDRQPPPLRRCEVAEKALDRVDADRSVERIAIARLFAGVVADAAVHRRQGVVAHQHFPGCEVFARLGKGEPGLDVLAGGTSVVARGQQVDKDRAPRAEGTRSHLAGEIDNRHQVS